MCMKVSVNIFAMIYSSVFKMHLTRALFFNNLFVNF